MNKTLCVVAWLALVCSLFGDVVSLNGVLANSSDGGNCELEHLG
jgi:hypothetical protein